MVVHHFNRIAMLIVEPHHLRMERRLKEIALGEEVTGAYALINARRHFPA
jgi:hypothetical protein